MDFLIERNKLPEIAELRGHFTGKLIRLARSILADYAPPLRIIWLGGPGERSLAKQTQRHRVAPLLPHALLPAVYPDTLKNRPQGASLGQLSPTSQAAHFCPFCRANEGDAFPFLT